MAKENAIFQAISKVATCNFCHEIIWNSPIYKSVEGANFCEKCTQLVTNTIYIRNLGEIYKKSKAI